MNEKKSLVGPWCLGAGYQKACRLCSRLHSFNQLAIGPREFWEDKKDHGSLLGMESTGASYIKLVSQMTWQTSVLKSLRPKLEVAL